MAILRFNSVSRMYTVCLEFFCVDFENNCVETNEDKSALSAAKCMPRTLAIYFTLLFTLQMRGLK